MNKKIPTWKKLLKDIKHWIGWGITTFMIYLLMYILGKGLGFWEALGLLGVVVFTDIIKHEIGLQ